MKKLNASVELPWIYFLSAVFYAFLVFIWPSDSWLIGWLAPCFFLAAIIFFAMAIAQSVRFMFHALRRTYALRTLPSLLPALVANNTPYSKENLPPPPRDPPQLANDVREISNNERRILAYLDYLNELRDQADSVVRTAFARYEDARSEVEDQQVDLYRLAQMAAKLAKKVRRTFPQIQADLSSVPQVRALPIPIKPTLATPGAYQTRLSQILRFWMAISRSSASGGIHGLLVGNAIAFAGSITSFVVLYQKTIRDMHTSAGELRRFIASAGDALELLNRAYVEVVAVSESVGAQSEELRDLILFTESWFKAQKAAGLPPSRVDTVQSEFGKLCNYALLARLGAATAI
jgi:hypothetical protein